MIARNQAIASLVPEIPDQVAVGLKTVEQTRAPQLTPRAGLAMPYSMTYHSIIPSAHRLVYYRLAGILLLTHHSNAHGTRLCLGDRSDGS
jgi:hypothetical protein